MHDHGLKKILQYLKTFKVLGFTSFKKYIHFGMGGNNPKVFAKVFLDSQKPNTGGPRYPRSFYLRIRLSANVKLA